VRVTTIPSGDPAFARAVNATIKSHEGMSARELEALLHPLYPRAAVMRSELSGDNDTLYVYRDGGFELESREEWWTAADVPTARISAESGLLLDVTDTWEGLMGGTADEFVGRHFSDLVHPDARAAAVALFDALNEYSDVRSTIAVRRADGSPVAVRFRAIRNGDEIIVYYRPA